MGLPGDTLELKEGILHINGQPVEKTPQTDLNILDDFEEKEQVDLYKEKTGEAFHYTLNYKDQFNLFNLDSKNFDPIVIPPNKLFVMGDNRDRSQDSRTWRFVPMENIKGRAMFVWLSLDSVNRFSFLKIPMIHFSPEFSIGFEPLPRIRWERFGKAIS